MATLWSAVNRTKKVQDTQNRHFFESHCERCTTMYTLSESINYIIITQQPWEEENTGSNIWDMARVLQKKHRVLLVNQTLDWSALMGKKPTRLQLRQQFIDNHGGQHLIELDSNFWLLNPKSLLRSINWLPDSSLYDWFNRMNGVRLANEIKDAVDKLGWKSYVILNDNDMIRGFYLKDILHPQLYVYYLRDNYLAVDYWKRHGKRLEPKLMEKSDLIASNSIYLANHAAQYNPNSAYVGQGCDLKLFNPDQIQGVPADIAAIPGPRIGYTGAITGLRLDANLIEAAARHNPAWQVVLIGPVDDSFPKARLNALPNIWFLEPKPAQQIPAYLAAMDVLINPQVFNEVTIGNYPRKIDEYLAMGKPVVAVKTETMSMFEEHVYLAETTDQFISYISDSLAGKVLSTPRQRIDFALTHTWDNSVGLLSDAIEQLLDTQPKNLLADQ